MLVYSVDNLEVDPIVGEQGSEFTVRFSVSSVNGTTEHGDIYIEFDTGFGWWRAETRSTRDRTIEHRRVIHGVGARRVRVTSDYPSLKLVGETRKSFTVLTTFANALSRGNSTTICEPCSLLRSLRGEIEVAVYYRSIDRSLEGQAGAKHDVRIQSLFDFRQYADSDVMPADARGWFANDVYGTINPFNPGIYMVSVTPSVGRGRTLGRDRVVHVDSSTTERQDLQVGPGEQASGLVHVYPRSRSRIDFVMQAEETWSDRTNTQIAGLHSEVLNDIKNIVNKIEGYHSIQATITHGLRTFAEQDDLYRIGRRGIPNERTVTNASGGQSYHNYGLAVDIYHIQGANLGNISANARAVFDLFQFYWGGNFGDTPHFEKSFGLSWQTLRARHDAQEFIPGTTFVDVAP